VEAERLESATPAEAAAAFARLADQATDATLAARALQAQARSLIKAGKADEALSLLTGPLEEERYRHARDNQGRLIVPNAELMALELLGSSASNHPHVPLERLKRRVLDYEDPALSAPQRRFLMRELQRLFSDPALAALLAAEDLAARYVEAGPAMAAEPGLRPSGLPGVWQSASSRGRVVTLHQAVWGSEVIVTGRSVDRCVTTLRSKIEPDSRNPRFVHTIRDIGYRFEDVELAKR